MAALSATEQAHGGAAKMDTAHCSQTSPSADPDSCVQTLYESSAWAPPAAMDHQQLHAGSPYLMAH